MAGRFAATSLPDDAPTWACHCYAVLSDSPRNRAAFYPLETGLPSQSLFTLHRAGHCRRGSSIGSYRRFDLGALGKIRDSRIRASPPNLFSALQLIETKN